jgi:hypothetical protein
MSTLISFFVSFLGTLGKLYGWFTHHEAVEEGAAKQVAADDKQELDDAEQANKTAVYVGTLTPTQLDEQLRKLNGG